MRNVKNACDCMFDVGIIGAGPAGVAAAIGIKSEGPSVVILDNTSPGGQAATSAKIENVFGAPVGGITGQDLMSRGIDQAIAFGSEMRTQFQAVRIVKNGDIFTVVAANRARITCASLLLGIGASHRRLDAKNLDSYIGRGVSYGPPQYRTPKEWEEKRVGIVGGGNSAGTVAEFLSKCAGCQVNMFVRGEGLEHDMSDWLLRHVEERPNITVHARSVIERVNGNGSGMSGVSYLQEGTIKTMNLDYLFILAGTEPQTGWLEDVVNLDPKGFILTDRDLQVGTWPATEGRQPFRFETSLPGVFAAGDAHSGSPKRMSCAVGEGHAVAVSVYQYLTLLRKKQEQAGGETSAT